MSLSERSESGELEFQRNELLTQWQSAVEWPMLLLALFWLALLIIEFAWGLTAWMQIAVTAIWVIFIIDFLVQFSLSPNKGIFLKRNALTAVSLLIPALRVFRFASALRVLKVARAARGVRLLRVVTSLNRGMKSLSASMSRRGVGFVSLLTLLVTLGGAAGMFAFEKEVGNPAFDSFSSAVWWTSMIMTTMGSEAWPKTTEGRFLCFLLSVYAFAVFGYVTAAIASFFVEREAASGESDVPSSKELHKLREEIQALHALILKRDVE